MGGEGVCQGEGGRATGMGKWAGVAGVASAAYRGQQGRVWPSVPVSGCRCEFPPKVFKVGNGESAGYAAKGGDCWYPVGPRGVIPEVRTEARGKLGELSVMRPPGASVPTGLHIWTSALFFRDSSPSPDFSFNVRLNPGLGMLKGNSGVLLI